MFTSLSIYRFLLKLYPSSYRQDYQDEMIAISQDMLHETSGMWQTVTLLYQLYSDCLMSLVRQHLLQFETVYAGAPGYIATSSTFSVSLVLPFFIICLYNWLNLYLLHLASNYVAWETKSWVIYCIIMPITAGSIVLLAASKKVIDNVRYKQLDTTSWLLFFLPISLLIVIFFM